MDYIYIETKPEKMKDFMKILINDGIEFDFVGRDTVMIHKMYFIKVGKLLDNIMIKSFASTIEDLG